LQKKVEKALRDDAKGKKVRGNPLKRVQGRAGPLAVFGRGREEPLNDNPLAKVAQLKSTSQTLIRKMHQED